MTVEKNYASYTMVSCQEANELTLVERALLKIKFGESLIKCINEFKDINGSPKLRRKINQEVTFLKKAVRSNTLKNEYLQCSNLTHYAAVIDVLQQLVKKCQAVNKVFILNNKKITVDIISNDGLTWIKVIARNPKALSQICMGNTNYGVRSVIDQAQEFAECAKLYPCLFQIPKIIFIFKNGVDNDVAKSIESYGVIVKDTKLDDSTELSNNSIVESSHNVPNVIELSTKNVASISKVNLDVSAMLAYCSSVTNGGAELYDFDIPILKQQAISERLRPQKPILEQFFKGKMLYCCQTAKYDFENIVKTVGGPGEQSRAKNLLQRLIVLPDNADYKSTLENDEFNEAFSKVQFTHPSSLKVRGKIRQRSLTIFTFGDRIRAVTVSANDGFVRAAKQQGINFVVFIHESRALTEQKEKAKAFPIVE
ncbi:hypothetical protein NQ315_003773 [Exocentrus adspersus]|uniref:DUF1308 domain-containing protein n=1 Tax=Exocentrus adspersus TaxID=1586481 RepID=A0AAV8VIB5_9CUCU|nr:hypothetical protein NQ315_003773 [Exocentrus adspersus]